MKKILTSLLFVTIFGVYVVYTNSISQTPSVAVATQGQDTGTPSQIASSGGPESSAPSPTPKQPSNGSGATVTQTPVDTKKGTYVDGTYVGDTVDAFYGTVQVSATIKNGAIIAVTFLQYPNEQGTSKQINAHALSILQQEAIAAQNANVDGVSGATHTTNAFKQSLASALSKAS